MVPASSLMALMVLMVRATCWDAAEATAEMENAAGPSWQVMIRQ
jgi:hypothetical protein